MIQIKINETSLIFQAVQTANNYSEWDVLMMLSVLSNEEKRWFNGYLSRITWAKTNDKIIRALAIMQDLNDQKLKFK